MKRRSTIFLWLAFLLAVLVGSGPALPAAGVWQCRHASEFIVSAPVSSAVMPCHRGGSSMPGMSGMACCAVHPQAAARRPHLAAPGCHPTFVPLAAVAAVSEQGRVPLPRLIAFTGAVPGGTFSLLSALITPGERQRPPPDICPPRSSCSSALRLRGPPSA